MRVHIDTDFAGDTDDACALAMVLGWPGAELTAVTTVGDPHGLRAGYARRLLHLAHRSDVRVESGAGTSLTTGAEMGGVSDHARYWAGEPVTPFAASAADAVAALDNSIGAGATVVAIGPYTNLALLERARPGRLAAACVVLMGGWTGVPAPGFPDWDAGMDWNVQCDTDAAIAVWAAVDVPTLVTLNVTLGVHLRAIHLDRLLASGPLGSLLARQARAHGAEYEMAALGRAHDSLPDDLLNFQYDPLACAVALGWPGVTVERQLLKPVVDRGVLHFEQASDGRPTNVVTDVDGDAFAAAWLDAVEAADCR